jgi:hypothetical protein
MHEVQSLTVHSPNLSKAHLMDLLGGLAVMDGRIRVREEKADSNLACDPATVALIAAAGMAVAELIKSATAVYLARKKSNPVDPPKPARVTVYLTLGGKRSADVTDAGQLDETLRGVSDYAEVARVELA